MRRALDETGVVYAPFHDETGRQDAVRTNYAVVSAPMRTVYLSIDTAADHAPRYQGFSQSEKQFARDVVDYAKASGYRTLVLTHVPANVYGRHGVETPAVDQAWTAVKTVGSWLDLNEAPGSKNLERLADARAFIRTLREQNPNVLLITGHVHPGDTRMDPSDADVDLDGKTDGKADVDQVILAGQKGNRLTRLTLYEHGVRIDDLSTHGSGASASTKVEASQVLSDENVVVPDDANLGDVVGVTFASADFQARLIGDDFQNYASALGNAVRAERSQGRAVNMIVAGDYVRDSLTPYLPADLDVFYTPGGHDLRDMGETPNQSIVNVVRKVNPENGTVDYFIDLDGY